MSARPEGLRAKRHHAGCFWNTWEGERQACWAPGAGEAWPCPRGASASHAGLSCSVSCDPADVRGAPLPSSHIVVIMSILAHGPPPSLPPSRSFLGAGLVHVLGHFPAPGTGSAKVRLLRSRMPACRQCGSANASPPGSLAAPPGRPPGPAQAPAVQRAASPRRAAFAVG